MRGRLRFLTLISGIGAAVVWGTVVFLLTNSTPPSTTLPTPMVLPSAQDNRSIGVSSENAATSPENNVQSVSLSQITSDAVAGQVVIRFAATATQQERAEYIASIGGTVTGQIDALDTIIVTLPQNITVLPSSNIITASEPDYYVSALYSLPTSDTYYLDQWALTAIGASEAWSIATDAPKLMVAVIDSGVFAGHSDLIGRVLGGWDFVQDDAVPQDEFGHGTAISGIIAANIDNQMGIAGIAPNVDILPLRVLNAQGIGTYSDVAAAMIYATDNGAKIINLSLGGVNPSNLLQSAVTYATSRGTIVIAAAGNSGVEGALYPAAYPEVIAVGSIDSTLQRSSFSNYGPHVDVYAPGRDILTTGKDGNYLHVTGTSFAAPHVAGIAALELARGRNLSLDGGVVELTPSEIATDDSQGDNLVAAQATCTITQVTTTTSGIAGLDTTIHRNGGVIDFVSDKNLTGENADGNREIFRWTQATGIIQLTDFSVNFFGSLSGTDNRLAFSYDASGTGNGPYEIYLWETSGIQQITNSPGDNSHSPEISADGTQILFLSNADLTTENPDNSTEIFQWEDGAGITQLTNDTYNPPSTVESGLDSNSSKMRIAFASTADLTGVNPDGNRELFLWDIGLGVIQLTNTTLGHSGLNYSQVMSHDGTRIAFYSTSDLTGENTENFFEVFLWEDGVGITQITDSTFQNIKYPIISGDGTHVIFDSRENFTGDNPDGNRELFMWSVADGLTQVTSATANIPDLVFADVSPSDNGLQIAFWWYADLTGGNPEENYEVFVASCQEAPLITEQPQNQTIDSGDTATLTVTAAGSQPLTYQWYEGVSGDPSNPVGTDSDTFETPTLTATTQYWVQVSNVHDIVDSDTAVITVDTLFCASVTEIPQTECEALEALYNSTDGANWIDNSGWLTTTTPCADWFGVSCIAGTPFNVVSISLPNNQLTGAIPPEIGNFITLQTLDLSSNQLSGSIPPEIGNLFSLEFLLLSYNQLEGNIPPEISNLSNLFELYLVSNQLEGSIPPQIANLDNLAVFSVVVNELSGTIPPEVGDMSNLILLGLADNQLSGNIPTALSNLSNLGALWLDNNQLTGSIPPELGDLSSLEILSLSDNQLEGSIPIELADLPILKILVLHNNRLSGAIPPELGDITTLETLLLQNNALIGGIPSSITNLTLLGTMDNLPINDPSLPDEEVNFGYNALYTNNPTVDSFLDGVDADWADTQTVIPTDFDVAGWNGTGFDVSWTPIPYTDDGGYYEVVYGTTQGGPYENSDQSIDKTSTSVSTLSLDFNTTYYFRVRTFTPLHGDQQNDLTSDFSGEILERTPYSVFCAGVSEIPQEECGALEELFSTTSGGSWIDNSGWLNTTTPCIWFGVTCAGGHITSLNLVANNLSGAIPAQISNLDFLQTLILSNNSLNGSFPVAIGSLSQLEVLLLDGNLLSGGLPAEIGNLTLLTTLHVENNAFTQPIQAETWTGLTNLTDADFGYNALVVPNVAAQGFLDAHDPDWRDMQTVAPTNLATGTVTSDSVALTWTPIPYTAHAGNYRVEFATNIGGPFNLHGTTSDKTATGYTVTGLIHNTPYFFRVQTFTPSHDEQQNDLFSDFSTVVSATTLFRFCNTVIEIPDIECQALEILYNSTNGASWTNNIGWMVTNTPCSWALVTCTAGHVTRLLLNGNNLTGTLPSEIRYLTALEELFLSDNQLTGTIPVQIGELTSLELLDLGLNQLSGSIPVEIGDLTTLKQLGLAGNQLTGSIPTSIGSLINLESIAFQNNQLTGNIPTTLGGLTNLVWLTLENNQLSGSIPSELGNLANLQHLFLNNNQLSGPIPASLGNLDNVYNFYLNSNQLSGSIPAELGNMDSLGFLMLLDNQLTGNIPSELGNISTLLNLFLDKNQLSGNIPSSLGNLSNLLWLGLSDNQLTGLIPPELGDIPNLAGLQLNNNQLSGNIPSELGSLSNLESLFLQNNALSGDVPTSIVNLTALGTGNNFPIPPYWLNDDEADFGYNALFATNQSVRNFLFSNDADWAYTQTVSPNMLTVSGVTIDSVTLSWVPILYTGDGGDYEVEFATNIGGPFTLHGTTADKTATGYVVTGLDDNTPYYFRVRTFTPLHGDQQNNLYSEYSSIVTATPQAPPATPTGLTAGPATMNTLPLTWTDNADDETHLSIERSPDGVNNWTPIALLLADAEAPPDTDTYTDTGLACNTTYHYRVRAYRIGDAKYSDYSTSTNGTTLSCPPPEPQTAGLYKDGMWNFRDTNTTGQPDVRFRFGPQEVGWTPLIGDWDGDGVDGIGVYKDGVWLLRNSADSGTRDIAFTFNPLGAGAVPLVGDWNADGIDTIGLYRNDMFAMRNSNSAGSRDLAFAFNPGSGWLPVAGDWNGDNFDTVGFYKDGRWLLTNALQSTPTTFNFVFGPTQTGWLPVTGDWNALNGDSMGLYKDGVWRLRNTNDTGGADSGFSFILGATGWKPVAGYRGGVGGLMALGLSEEPIAPILPTPVTPTPDMTTLPEVTATTPIEMTVVPTESLTMTETPLAPTDTPTESTPVVTESPPPPTSTEAPPSESSAPETTDDP